MTDHDGWRFPVRILVCRMERRMVRYLAAERLVPLEIGWDGTRTSSKDSIILSDRLTRVVKREQLRHESYESCGAVNEYSCEHGGRHKDVFRRTYWSMEGHPDEGQFMRRKKSPRVKIHSSVTPCSKGDT